VEPDKPSYFVGREVIVKVYGDSRWHVGVVCCEKPLRVEINGESRPIQRIKVLEKIAKGLAECR